MADLNDLGGGSGKRHQFPPFEKSAVERLAEAMKSPFDGLDLGIKSLDTAQNSIKEALGGTLSDYYKSRDHMREVFGSKSLADEVDKLVNGSTLGTEVDRYMAGLELSRHERSILDDLPPMPDIPPNPIYETNEHLADLGQKIDALVDLQAKQSDVIDKLLQVQIANDAAQERSTKRSYRLGVINAVMATILGVGAIVATVLIAG